MKKYLLFTTLLLTLFLTNCTALLEEGEVVFNFCDLESDYIDCSEIALTTTTIEMGLDVLSSDVTSVDSIIYELPDEEVYCTADTSDGSLAANDDESYSIEASCDLSSYEDQNTQLAFSVTLTLTDGRTVTEEGTAEDWV
ncbi:MAG: hypothetical protein AABX82_09090 [Nanoarchaeota archaeon]